ncbi:MAG TPA: PPOX class F420-dependent oxidoreductase [Nitrososphaerales archaeon]|nr:PPOX class F420-dependent oxidoreductase [Nitrososphaerales archaeon]
MAQLNELAKRLIDGKNLASVATLMPDGSPQVAPVWVDREGDTIVINAPTKRQRYHNLKRDPRVALCVYDAGNTFANVMIRGRATEITEEGAWENADKLSMKYMGIKGPHRPETHRVVIRITPEHITTWAFKVDHEEIQHYE